MLPAFFLPVWLFFGVAVGRGPRWQVEVKNGRVDRRSLTPDRAGGARLGRQRYLNSCRVANCRYPTLRKTFAMGLLSMSVSPRTSGAPVFSNVAVPRTRRTSPYPFPRISGATPM